MLPLLPGGGDGVRKGMNKVNIYATMLLLGLTLVTVQTQPVWALNGSGIGQQIATAIRGVIVEIINIVTPIINILGVGMIVIGLLLGLGLRQEFLGFRLAIGGALALLTVHVIVPLLLGFV
jgi:hypothetical protein